MKPVFFILSSLILFSVKVNAKESENIVTFENYPYVESTIEISNYQNLAEGVNKWYHFRTPTPLDNQPTIRMNRDTLYSMATIDVSQGAKVTLPDAGERYISLMIVNEDGYTNKVWYGKGEYELNKDVVGTDYAFVIVRIFLDSNDKNDVTTVNNLQDNLKIEAASDIPFEPKNWDMTSYHKVHETLIDMFQLLPNTLGAFGKKENVDPIRFILGSAGGYGGLPEEDAFYMNVSPGLSDGKYEMTLKDVPVDGFVSFSLYNKEGFFFQSDSGLPSLNNVTAQKNPDNSFTVYFGGCDTRKINCLALTDGWNFVVRLYQPRKEILNGSWSLPSIKKSQ
ncbi:TPA: DUF1254 domain-containing protein [Vibrio campbellii]|jgi:hypothetical protein|nr:DUF1254 domain-containing protein [Vibrio campbellii]